MAKKHVSCPVPLKVQNCNFQVGLLKTIHMFFFTKLTYMFLWTIFVLRKATTTGSSQPQIYPRCSHVFWRMESYHNHHPHKGLVAWLEPWKWALGKGLIYNPSFFWIVLLITYNHGLGIYTHNPGIEFTDCKNLPVDPSFIKKKGIKGHSGIGHTGTNKKMGPHCVYLNPKNPDPSLGFIVFIPLLWGTGGPLLGSTLAGWVLGNAGEFPHVS